MGPMLVYTRDKRWNILATIVYPNKIVDIDFSTLPRKHALVMEGINTKSQWNCDEIDAILQTTFSNTFF